MKKFEQELKQKAHLNKIKNAKKTVLVPNKNMNRISAAKSQQAQVLLNLYEKKRFDSIPAYKLLKTAGLQQYTRGFIERGYGVKLGALSALSDKDKQKLYDDLKIMPGHTVKLDKLIQTISRHSYLQPQQNLSSNFSSNQDEQQSVKISKASELEYNQLADQPRSSKQFDKTNSQANKVKITEKYDPQFQKQLQRVFNQYTPSTNEKNKEKRISNLAENSASSSRNVNKVNEKRASSNKIKIDHKQSNQYEKKLQKIANQFTPLGDNKDKKKKTFNQGINYNVIDKKTPSITSADPSNKYTKTKYVPNTRPQIDFKKKTIENKTTVNTVKKVQTKAQILKLKSGISNLGETSKRTKNMNLGLDQPQQQISTSKIMQINLQCDKIKSFYRSFDGALMSSTIANIDIQQLVYAFAGYVCSIVIPAPQIKIKQTYQYTQQADDKNISHENQTGNLQQSIDDEVGNILRESYLHPLYTQDPQIDEDIDHAQQTQIANQQNLANSEGQQQLLDDPNNQFLSAQIDKTENLQASSVSSFLGGESYHFGLQQPLNIFDQPEPTQLDYLKPTSDSVANFIKNIVLTAKMQREIPIMAARYLQVFIQSTGLAFTSLNYRRILVTLLLLASKIWDDESFQSPSFSKTFPQYNTVLLNQMQKQVLKALDYKLKLDKKQYAQIYFQLRKFARKNLRSCQNKKISLQKIRQLQKGLRIEYKSNFLQKRPSF